MKKWRSLEKGDVVDLVAPGWACTRDELKLAVELLKSWGLRPRYPKKIFGRHLLCANSDINRLEYLREALLSPTSKAVWCLRGGYGSARLMPELLKLKPPERAKLLVGFSDITVLHTWLVQKWQWSVLHGALLDRLGRRDLPKNIIKETKDVVFGKLKQVEFRGLKPLNKEARQKGSIVGAVVGGNLTMVETTIGTPWELNTKNKILFVEDVGERGYRVDRMLQHLFHAELFDRVRALVFGRFTKCAEASGRDLVPAVLREFALQLDIPVFRGLQCGHGDKQRPLPLGTNATVVKGVTSGTLICPTGSL